jgi:DNA topoisomerase IB
VCRKYYVHPAVLEAYYLGRTIPHSTPEPHAPVARRTRGAALRREELAVLQFLQDEAALIVR